ncbi:MAG: ABC transporter permease [Bacteroidia bacterium]|nr:ABC transporter permease [Bacteroidia bacterium]
MSSIFTIIKKEFLDTLRDRRTLITMIVLPLVLFPAIFGITITVQKSLTEKAMEKELKVGLIVEGGQAADLISAVETAPNLVLIRGIALEDTARLIRNDSLDMIMRIDSEFDSTMARFESGRVMIYYLGTEDDNIRERLEAPMIAYEQAVLGQRMQALQISPATVDPINIDTSHDLATTQEQIGKLAGGFLPYIFVIFSFIGCMYPAIDLFTGEKERGTMETLFTLPVSRIEILVGKLVVVATSGLISALIGILGLVLSLQFLDIPDMLREPLLDMAKPYTIIMLILMILPLAVFFAGILVPITTYAKTFKEAQSLITPLNLAVIIPAAIGLMPGIELNAGTALIPILNVALAAKEILAGTVDYGLLSLVFLSLIVIASVAVVLSVKMFGKESNIMRT